MQHKSSSNNDAELRKALFSGLENGLSASKDSRICEFRVIFSNLL
jgi:hypothetical protein